MSKRIQGITIEIDGSTTKLNDALKDTSKVISSTNSELKNLNQALKLDPKNTELLAQKQDVLKNNIQATTEKLDMLKEAQRQMGDYNSLTDEQKESYRALSVEIAKSESALEGMQDELKSMSKIDLSKLKDALVNIGKVAAEAFKKVAQITAAIGTALTAVVAAGVKSYASLEQNIGGVETLFGAGGKTLKEYAKSVGKSTKKVKKEYNNLIKAQELVMKNAANAYKTAGVSANEYMQGVTAFSASLIKSLGGNTKKAAKVADMAFRDMSDNANKFGTDMSAIQSAYQGFAKQNYTMLDNLKLGYGGTKTEMKRLLKDAKKISGVKYNINNLSDVYNAIHVIQKELGVTGTTAKEATQTISGSIGSMKAAFDNFLNGTGSPEQLAETITNVLVNIGTAFQELLPSIVSGLGQLLTSLAPLLADLLWELLPSVLDTISNFIKYIYEKIGQNTEDLKQTVTMIINEFVNFFVNNLPMIIELGLTLILALAEGIADALPDMVPAIVDVVVKIVDILTQNVDKIIEVALVLILALAKGIIKAIPKLVAAVPKIVTNIVTGIKNVKDKMLDGASTLMGKLGSGITEGIPKVAAKAKDVVVGFWKKFKTFITETDWLELGKNILKGILNGMLNFGTIVKDTIKKVGKKITSAIKDFFGISSPSKLMSKEVGQYLTEGIGVGIEKGIPETIRDVNRAMTSLNNGIQSSLNPVINPTANTNPLVIQIENFNNTRNQDIQALAQELEFYRKNSAMARGGN